MTFKELEQHAIFPNGSRILPLFEENKIVLEDGSIEYDYIIIKSSEEIYNEWLADKDKPVEPNEMEVLQKQIDELKLENQKLWDTCNHLINVNLDLQHKVDTPQCIPNII